MARRILVTAATGTVGGATMQALRDADDEGVLELLGTARSEDSAGKLQKKGFKSVNFDYDDPKTLQPALEGVDSVFLVTGYTVDMLVHCKRLLDAAKAAKVPHIVHLGALAPHDTPHAHFAWHQLIERTIEAMGFSFTHLQPNFFIDTVWAGFRQRPDRLVHFIGNQRVSWISAHDMAAVAAASLSDPETHSGKTYPLATEALTLTDVAEMLSSATGRQVEYRPRPATDLLPILLKQGMEPVYAASLAAGVKEIEAGNSPLAGATYDTVRQVTSREPITWQSFIDMHRNEIAAA